MTVEEQLLGLTFSGKDDTCLYCNGEGRTKEDPYHCKYCGRGWVKLHEEENKDINLAVMNGYPVDKILIERAQNWSQEYCKDVMRRSNKPILNKMEILLKRLELEIDKISNHSLGSQQLMVSVEPMFYELILVSWAYRCMYTACETGYSITGNFTNLEYLRNINLYNTDLINKDLLFVELNLKNLDESLETLDALCTLRKRLGVPTYIFTKVGPDGINKKKGFDVFADEVTLTPELYMTVSEFTTITLITSISSRGGGIR